MNSFRTSAASSNRRSFQRLYSSREWIPQTGPTSRCCKSIFEHFIRQINTNHTSVRTHKLVPPGTPSLDSSPLVIFDQLPIPSYIHISQQPFSHPRERGITEAVPFIPGGGLTRRILSSLPQEWSTPTLSLLQFTCEGDNRADAQLLASVVSKLFDVPPTENGASNIRWKQPKSWDSGLFGTPHDQTLYG